MVYPVSGILCTSVKRLGSSLHCYMQVYAAYIIKGIKQGAKQYVKPTTIYA